VTVLDGDRDRLKLRVVDRLTGAVAVRAGARVPLPRDESSSRVVCLRRGSGGWRVVSVS
jgi:hypothetical protein